MNCHLSTGVWGVLATPFVGAARELDERSLARLAEHAAGAGVTGLTVLGVFGEASRLSWAERRRVLEVVRDATALPLVVGCTSLGTAPVIDEARMAAEVVPGRLAALMVQANSPQRDVLHRHFTAVHDASAAPIVIQDYPVASGVSVSSAVLGDLAASLSFVAAVKAESPPTPLAVAELTQQCDVPVFGGLGGINLLDELACGAAGAMTGFSYPEVLVACVRAWPDQAAAREALIKHLPLITFEQQAGIALAIRKECLRRRSLLEDSSVRPPARTLPEALVPVLGAHLESVGASAS